MNTHLQNKSKISVVLLCKNEAVGLVRVINSIKKHAYEIIVVDGHSTDASLEIARNAGAIAVSDHGQGKGDGIKMGLNKAKGDVVILMDADGSHNALDIPKLARPVFDGEADLVVGSRRTGGSMEVKLNLEGLVRSAGVDLMTFLVNLRFKTDLTDLLYGFKAIKRETAMKLKLKSNDFAIDQEIAIKCLKNNFRVMQIPSHENARMWGKSKLKTIFGIKLFIDLIRQLYGK